MGPISSSQAPLLLPTEEARSKIKLLELSALQKSKRGGETEKGNREGAEGNRLQPGPCCLCPTSLLEQLQDADNNVIDVTKPRSLRRQEKPLEQDGQRARASKRRRNTRFASLPQTSWRDAGPLPSLLRYHRSKEGKRS